MAAANQVFNETSVVEYHAEGVFKAIPHKSLIDFLPRIYKSDIGILETWKGYFKRIGTPFAVTKTIDAYRNGEGRTRKVARFVLWKQRRA